MIGMEDSSDLAPQEQFLRWRTRLCRGQPCQKTNLMGWTESFRITFHARRSSERMKRKVNELRVDLAK
jgi:hypothetical protein